jgi:hypothetical protein
MNYFSLIVTIIGIVWLSARLEAFISKKSLADKTANVKPDTAAPAKVRRVLNIEGTERFEPKNMGFVKGFGLKQSLVADIARIIGPGSLRSFPAQLQANLKTLYEQGCLHGEEAMKLVCKNGDLKADQALYLVMVSPPNQPDCVVGFIDRTGH